jgi:hypothetical protein
MDVLIPPTTSLGSGGLDVSRVRRPREWSGWINSSRVNGERRSETVRGSSPQFGERPARSHAKAESDPLVSSVNPPLRVASSNYYRDYCCHRHHVPWKVRKLRLCCSHLCRRPLAHFEFRLFDSRPLSSARYSRKLFCNNCFAIQL